MNIIPLFKVFMAPGLMKPLEEVLYSGYIGQGKKVDEFEELLKVKFEHPYIATVNSCTSGLHLLLRLLGKPGDEVLTSPLTCTATNWPILANGMKIKWVDVDESCNMDLDDLERKITEKTKIIMLTHWGGNPVKLSRVSEILLDCRVKFDFMPKVIQDAAHSIGSKWRGQHLSNYGNSAFSFQAIKHFTTVDGGCIALRNEELYKRAKLLRWYGIDRETKSEDFRCELPIEEWGYKFHMNDVNATIGIHNLPFLDGIVEKHVENSDYYDSQKIDGVTHIIKDKMAYSSQWIHTIHVENRDNFMRHMKANGIMVSRVHERNDLHGCTKEFRTLLPGLEKVIKTMICIPNGWWVTKEDREYIVETMKKGW